MKQQYLEAGQIVSAHGLRGEVKVYPWADSPAFLTGLPRVYLGGQAYAVEHGRVQKSCALLKLQGVDTVEEAQRLRGKTVLVNREDVPLAPGTYFIADLIGLRVLAGGRGDRRCPGGAHHARQRCLCGPGPGRAHDPGGAGIYLGDQSGGRLYPGEAH